MYAATILSRSAIATTTSLHSVARITWTLPAPNGSRIRGGDDLRPTAARVDPPVTVAETYRIGRRKVEVTICAPCRIANDRRDAR